MYSLCLILLAFFPIFHATIYEVDKIDVNKCQFYHTNQVRYNDFFAISEHSQRNGSTLEFHFGVRASSEAHLLLSPTNKNTFTDPVYEVIIGGEDNTHCSIRRKAKLDEKFAINMTGLLDANVTKFFWLHIDEDGLLEIGKEGEETPFMHWKDPEPLHIKYFSFATLFWHRIEAIWFYDCMVPPIKSNATTNITEVSSTENKICVK